MERDVDGEDAQRVACVRRRTQRCVLGLRLVDVRACGAEQLDLVSRQLGHPRARATGCADEQAAGDDALDRCRRCGACDAECH